MTGLIIQEVYGGGGTGTGAAVNGSAYNSDYVVIQNTSSDPISLSGYAIQTRNGPDVNGSGVTNPWTSAALPNVTVAAYGYVLIKLGPAHATFGSALPTPDIDLSLLGTPLSLGPTNGRVALTSNTITLTGSETSGGAIVDFVGYGSTAASFEGAGRAPAGSSTNSIQRVANTTSDAWDTNNNNSDFVAQAASPHNAASGTINLAPTVKSSNFSVPATYTHNVAENATTVIDLAAFDAEGEVEGPNLTYAIVPAGSGGAADSGFFSVDSSSGLLTFNAPRNFEAPAGSLGNTYKVTIRLTDVGGASSDQVVTVNVTNVNEAPTAVNLSASSIDENNAPGATVATLTATDEDAGDSAAFTLVAGLGDTDNAAFTIVGNELHLVGSADFETKSTYSIRIRVTDGGANSYETIKTINVNDLNEHAPTAINLSASSIAENNAPLALVATLTASDADPVDSFTFALVAGGGDTDNSAFTIVGNELHLVGSADYETQSSYSIRLQVTDSGGLTHVETRTITVSPVNEFSPTAINLSQSSIDENNAPGAVVASLTATDQDGAESFTFALVAGSGSADNAAFTIVGNELRINASADFETKAIYSIRLQVTDSGGHSYQTTKTITVNDLNDHAPTTIDLSASSIAENNAVGATVALLTSQDIDSGETFTYSLVAGSGDTDNALFSIVGNQLRINTVADFESDTSYSVRIKVIDSAGLTFEAVKTITVTNVNDFTPTAIALGSSAVTENNAPGATVGLLSATDGDGIDSFTFALVAGAGSTDNAAFTIVGNELRLNASADYELKSSYSIRVQVTDSGGLTYQTTKTITVNDLNDETPTAIALSSSSVTENNIAGVTVATLSATDADLGDTFTFSLVSGPGSTDNAAFTIVGNQLKLLNSADFETKSTYAIRVQVVDAAGHSFQTTKTITVTDVNEAPTAVVLTNTTTSLAENTSTAVAIKLADIAIADDALGAATLSLSGADAAYFEVVGGALYLKAGTQLDYEQRTAFSVAINADDAAVGGAVDATTTFVLGITDVSPEVVQGTPFADILLSGAGSDQLLGLAGNDYLDAGADNDVMSGGAGDDTYVVDSVGDQVIEQPGEGIDTVVTSVDWTLGDNVENLIMRSGAVRAVGNDLDNVMTGTDGNDLMNGWRGNDIIEGGAGNDTINGYKGVDTASYAHATGPVTVTLNINAAQDTGGAGVDYLVSIENLFGSAYNDHLTGSKAANYIDGLGGADDMRGLKGNDLYVVDNAGDVIHELAKQGTDSVLSSVTYQLGLGSQVENLYLTGGNSIDATGNELANTIAGNAAANILTGGGGRDTFLFSAALGPANVDTLADFSVTDDTIALDHGVFSAIGHVGALGAAELRIGASAADADDRIVYDPTTGALYFDADGSGSGAQVQFAVLAPGLALSFKDFVIL